MHGSGAAQMRPWCRFYNQSPPTVGSSAENLRVSDPTWIEGVKVQTVFFFPRLIAVLTPAVFCYLQSYAFIPRARCPRWFRSLPFLSGLHPKVPVGDGIIIRVLINCISHFLLCKNNISPRPAFVPSHAEQTHTNKWKFNLSSLSFPLNQYFDI